MESICKCWEVWAPRTCRYRCSCAVATSRSTAASEGTCGGQRPPSMLRRISTRLAMYSSAVMRGRLSELGSRSGCFCGREAAGARDKG